MSRPWSRRFRPRGRDSSRSIRTQRRQGCLAGQLHEMDSLIPLDRREVSKKHVKGVARLQVVQKGLHQDPGTSKDGRTAHLVGRYLNDVLEGSRGSHILVDSTPSSSGSA